MVDDKIASLIKGIQTNIIQLQLRLPANIQSVIYQNPPVIVCYSNNLQIVKFDSKVKDISLLDYLPKVAAYLVNRQTSKVIHLSIVLNQLSSQQKEAFLQSIVAEYPKEWFLLINCLGLQAAKLLNVNLARQRFLLVRLIPPTANLVNIK